MNPDLEAKLRGLPLRNPDPAWKEGILDTALAGGDKKRVWIFSFAALPAWFSALKFRYRLGFGALTAVWMLTLYFHLAAPREELLAVKQFDHAPNISAQEMLAAMYYRNRLIERWSDYFEPRIERNTGEVPPRYRL